MDVELLAANGSETNNSPEVSAALWTLVFATALVPPGSTVARESRVAWRCRGALRSQRLTGLSQGLPLRLAVGVQQNELS